MVPPRWPDEQGRPLRSRVTVRGLLLGGLLLAACTTTPSPPADAAEALQARCVRTGGWWRPNVLDGFCEYQLPMP